MRISLENIEKYNCKCPESNDDFLHMLLMWSSQFCSFKTSEIFSFLDTTPCVLSCSKSLPQPHLP